MKLLILLLCLAQGAFADIGSDLSIESEEGQQEYIFDSQSKMIRSNDSWYTYYNDGCEEFRDSQPTDQRIMGIRFCKDGSTSYVQPPSRGVSGYEGKCGHALAANMLAIICKRVVHPAKYFDSLFSDITPGVRPSTFVKGVDLAFDANSEHCPSNQGNWVKENYDSAQSFIDNVTYHLSPKYSHPNQMSITRDGNSYTRNPVGILLLDPGSRIGLHWVMVIDRVTKDNQCHFVVNHWDSQFVVPCSKLAKWSKEAGEAVPIFINSYQIVFFK